jgi:hypothetical protein
VEYGILRRNTMVQYIVDDNLDNEYNLEELCDHICCLTDRKEKPYSLEECIDLAKKYNIRIYTFN